MGQEAPATNTEFTIPAGHIAGELMDAMDGLNRLFQQESVLLEAGRISDIPPLQVEKTRLANEFRIAMTRIKSDPSSLGPKQSELRCCVREAVKNFQGELEDHGKILFRKKIISDGMIKTINEEVLKQSGAVRRYDPNARVEIRAAGGPLPIALNRII